MTISEKIIYCSIDIKRNLNLSESYNFVHDTDEIFPKDERESSSTAISGHGTHITGIIGAKMNNGEGIVGIVLEAEIIELKALGSKSGSYTVRNKSDVTVHKVIEYAQQKGVKLINYSITGTTSMESEKEAIRKAPNMLFVVPAGNNGYCLGEEGEAYPVCFGFDNCIVVANIDENGELALNSNYGRDTDIAASGTDILSTFTDNMDFEEQIKISTTGNGKI